jgi:hypothetical protein
MTKYRRPGFSDAFTQQLLLDINGAPAQTDQSLSAARRRASSFL